jgi:15-cis-phytoene synthase
MTVGEAYRHCEQTTRREAANFYYGIRLLAPAQRRGMCAVYAFARRVDDIGDGPLAAAEKLKGLEREAQALARMPRDSDEDPVLIALADAYQRFQIPPDALLALIEGVRMDVEEVRYETFEELVLYCRRVAGAIGRACLAIFGCSDGSEADRAQAVQLADDLGVALQLTNILRDLREDAVQGRVYLPAQDMRRYAVIGAGQEAQAPVVIATLAARAHKGYESELEDLACLCALMRYEADRARGWFRRGIALTAQLDRRSAACVLAMANIYKRLLVRIEDEPLLALQERLALRVHEKAWVATRSMLGDLAGRGA